jgi:hypothetical protein
MNGIRLSTFAALLLLLGLAVSPQVSQAGGDRFTTYGDRFLTGELVITGANRFRLVDHGGSFTAPAGTSLLDFDGKPVRVEFSRDGRALQITEMPIHYEPITHDEEFLSGELIVQDAAMRSFAIAGDSRTFVAPSGIDVGRYAGQMVEIRLNEGRVADIQPTARPGGSAVFTTCSYNGQGYAEGAITCQAGYQYRCDEGTWRSAGTACGFDGATSSRGLRNCMVGGVSVASGSSVCRDGTTFQCVNGEWVNAWTACS